ncbi:helix-turn-helix domain-containing protein [Mucilaginibacter psychrotolerans]|uniref:XRE family transcriptional regulator n=1 Tax=Mucilaginibacter psychrotolerans TaxID=1524096 RepID=A0A4Y8S9U6_9SPHI|nr:helix-turn-helix transcriptional regulator [Mucilaginibacter psychrotolerans]TFF35789.1 XRE family transcriptional regulator [Mucilaginibacter psychrotolerans]
MQEILSKKEIGLRIKSLREKESHSQEFMAEKLGISRSNYSQIEIGNQYPTFQSLSIIASFYSKSFDWFIHGIDSNQSATTSFAPKEAYTISQPLSTKTVLVDENTIYIKNCRSLQYLENLSPFERPSTMAGNDGLYRAFSFKKQMLNYVFPDDIIVGRAVENYDEIAPDQIYIIVTHVDILLCYINDISAEASMLNCRTDQLLRPKFQLHTSDIQEIWVAVEKYSTKIQPISTNWAGAHNSIEALIQSLKKEVAMLKKLKK